MVRFPGPVAQPFRAALQHSLQGFSVRLNELRLLSFGRLRHAIRSIDKEYCDLLVDLPPDIDGAVDAVAWFFPLDLPRDNVNALRVAPITKFDREFVTRNDDRHSVERVAMPRHRFAGGEPQPAHLRCIPLEEHLVGHKNKYDVRRAP